MVKLGYTVVVSGATGAVGRDLVAELVRSPNSTKVVALTRREIPKSDWATAFPLVDTAIAETKLEVRPVNFDALPDDLLSADGADASFCCLGTTRNDAGSAEAFRKVDLEYTTRVAKICKLAGVGYFGLLSATNAKKTSWFLYPKTKGEAEESIGELHFERTSVFRPGMIDRGKLSRPGEKIFSYIAPTVSTLALAKAMVADYECDDAAPGQYVLEMKELRKFDAAK